MGRAAKGNTASALAATARDDRMYGERLKLQLAVLQQELPALVIWYVLMYPIGTRWCARPLGCQDGTQTVYADSAEELAEAIGEIITETAP